MENNIVIPIVILSLIFALGFAANTYFYLRDKRLKKPISASQAKMEAQKNLTKIEKVRKEECERDINDYKDTIMRNIHEAVYKGKNSCDVCFLHVNKDNKEYIANALKEYYQEHGYKCSMDAKINEDGNTIHLKISFD